MRDFSQLVRMLRQVVSWWFVWRLDQYNFTTPAYGTTFVEFVYGMSGGWS